jgi:NitT/TauT family transport system substrate-binding protein
VLVAQDAGFFAEEGLRVEEVVIPGAPAFAALANNELQALAFDTSRHYLIAGQGDDRFLFIQKVLDSISLDVVFSKAYAERRGVKPSDPLEARLRAMKGGRWGTLSLGSAPHIMQAYLGKRVGLDPERDMSFVALGAVPNLFSAVKEGQVDGYMLSAPNSLAAEVQGFGYVMIPYADVPEFFNLPHEGLFVTKAYAAAHGDVVRALVRAIARGREMLVAQPDRAAELLAKRFPGVSLDLIKRSVALMHGSAFGPGPGTLSQQEIDRHIALLREAGMLQGPVRFTEGVHWTNAFLPGR